ncbi:MAG: ketopantoate reductase family protein [Bacteroidota bacterium]|jgi:2-dehydropantoate 2-reductase
MSIIVLGAGAVGCFIAGKLARAGVDVTVVARGPALAAIADRGITVSGEQDFQTDVRSMTADNTEPAEVVISCIKAHSIPDAARTVARLLKPHGMWVCVQNGIPWWYTHGLTGPLQGVTLESVDPGGGIAAAVPHERTAGAVVYARCETTSPGEIVYKGGKGLILGEINGPVSSRVRAFADLLQSAGLNCATTDDIRSAVWSKLFGNVSMNPLTAITGLTMGNLVAEPRLAAFAVATIEEAQQVAIAAGSKPDMTPEARVKAMALLTDFRTSMLQDASAGRLLELDAILAAPVEIARRLRVPVPGLELLLAMTSAFAETRGLRPAQRAAT